MKRNTTSNIVHSILCSCRFRSFAVDEVSPSAIGPASCPTLSHKEQVKWKETQLHLSFHLLVFSFFHSGGGCECVCVCVSVCVNAGPLSRSPHQPCFSPDRQLLIARTSVSVLNLPIEPSTNRLHTGNQSMMNIFNAIHLLVLRLRIGTGRHERWRHRRRTR